MQWSKKDYEKHPQRPKESWMEGRVLDDSAESAEDLGTVTEEEILNTGRQYQSERKKMLTAKVVAPSRKKAT